MYRINEMKCNEMKGKELKSINHCNELKNKSAAVDGAFRSSVVMPVISDQDTGKSHTFDKPLNEVSTFEKPLNKVSNIEMK